MTDTPDTHTILGVGGAVCDIMLTVDDAILDTIPGEKGGMECIDSDTLAQVLSSVDVTPTIMPGGCTSNTLKGLASLGHRCAMIGKVGNDAHGDAYIAGLRAHHIIPYILQTDEIPTTEILCLVTTDGERTMRTHIGASLLLRQHELTPSFFQGIKLMITEGYSLLNDDGKLTESAMKSAYDAGATVAYDFSSFELVNSYKELLNHLLTDYVDIIFSNEEEVLAFTGKGDKEGCRILGTFCSTAVVTLGKEGALVAHNGEMHHFPHPSPVEFPLDTTGAGDLFASGFLHGVLQGHNIKDCADLGAITGAAVVNVLGAEIPQHLWSMM